MPRPIRYVVPGEPVTAARFNELVTTLNQVSTVRGAYPVEVRQTMAGLEVGLAREFKTWLFEIGEFEAPPPTTTDGVPYYPAARVRLDASDEYSPGQPQDVRLWDPLAKNDNRRLEAGDLVVAMFNADTGRWEIISDARGASEVVRFQLNGALALGGAAAASILSWNGVAYVAEGDPVTVHDFTSAPGTWSGPAGYRGFAIRLDGLYEILFMERVALFVRFTLNAHIEDGEASASRDAYWRGKPPTTTIDVYDDAGIHSAAVVGDEGIACWDDIEARYKIIDMRQSATALWAKATADWTTGSPPAIEAVKVDDALGANPGDAISVLLPRAGDQDPNLRQDDVFAYQRTSSGELVCVSDYLDDKIGTMKMWIKHEAFIDQIPRGWALMDGAANSVANGGSGIDMGRKYVGGFKAADADDVSFANIGNDIGIRNHSHEDHAAGVTGSRNLTVNPSDGDTATGHTDANETGITATLAAATGVTVVAASAGTPAGTISSQSVTVLEATVSGTTDSATTGIEVHDPTTGTVSHPDHAHELMNNAFALGFPDNTLGGATPCTGGAVTVEAVGDCGTGTGIALSHEVDDPGHEHGFTSDPHDHATAPHNHVFSGVLMAAHGHTINDPQHDHDINDPGHEHPFSIDLPAHDHTISPNPHNHTTPGYTHSLEDHYPETVVVAFIERIN
jgi:hypothetical protein